ncbi:MAG: hypothetical protein B9S32_01160 [Verrucomicrobia bacterium Tous-C9LFEB]|nr:MAG: hypothetical protein B9S32_01160 [Verrucomicrobia bacterium Tous-C9LFEB]
MPLVTELPPLPLHQAAHDVSQLLDHGVKRTHSLLIRAEAELDEHHWLKPILIAVGLNVVIFAVGFYSPKNTLLELISQGEQLANAAPSVEEMTRQEVEIVDLAPPPPPEANPEFIKPEEKPKIAEVKPEPKPRPVVQQPRTEQASLKFAASNVVIGNKNFPKPLYPYVARVKRFQGTVMVGISVIGGRVVSAEVQSSSGYGVLDVAASSWIREKWNFPEGTTTTITIPVKYELSNG